MDNNRQVEIGMEPQDASSHKETDHFFGDVSVWINGEGARIHASLSLEDVIRSQRKVVSKIHLTQQLRRLTKEYGNIRLLDSRSSPPFWELLSLLNLNDIHFLSIGLWEEKHSQITGVMANCTLHFLEGHVTVWPYWTLYKTDAEFLSTLVGPLRKNDLIERTVKQTDASRMTDSSDVNRQNNDFLKYLRGY
ncbi:MULTISPECIES: hypothetical protein [Acetobacter]|jgi:hypothetical protein|uniref:hypothetical protein n=1 Tax=Acetobacter TaxID=434 RepID=UPI0025B9114E|nr:hypothetical protein [Acetobacter sp.]MCH4092715.1 hypothetical protein [Acetobacter sp.]